jgi:hypothetical protein
MSLGLLWLVPDTAQWLAWGWQLRAPAVLAVCAAGGLCYLLVHLLLGSRFQDLRAPRVPGGE